MNVIWSDTAVHCINSMGGAVESFAEHNNDHNAALRLCALKVAAMIGEGMDRARRRAHGSFARKQRGLDKPK